MTPVSYFNGTRNMSNVHIIVYNVGIKVYKIFLLCVSSYYSL